MNHNQIVSLSFFLFFLIFLSGFFSIAETGLMAINRYRVRHKARLNKRPYRIILTLLKRPDRLLGMILIGNTIANILSSVIATLLAIALWGERGVILSSIILTGLILIFAEVAPKTFAALHPDGVSKIIAWPIFILLKIFYPFVWLINAISNGFLFLLGTRVSHGMPEQLTREELRSVVYDTTGKVSHSYQAMLLAVLDLNKVTVDEVMVPLYQIFAIDLNTDFKNIREKIIKTNHTWVPVYQDVLSNIVGLLHVPKLVRMIIQKNELNSQVISTLLEDPYFIPEGTPLHIQLANFQRQSHHKPLALVVDEYGEIKGLLTPQDIVEEIVGEFSTVTGSNKILLQSDGSYLVDGAITVREFNRTTQWHLPTPGPRTVSGLIIEFLEAIPRPGICILVSKHPIEIVHVKDNRVKLAKIYPQQKGDK